MKCSKNKKNTWEARKYVSPRDDGIQPSILPLPFCPLKYSLNKTLEELKKIIEDSNEYDRRKCDENALAIICTNSIILRDPNRLNDFFNETEMIGVERKDKWRPCKKGPDFGGNFVYNWDIVPDVTYTVLIRMVSAKDRIDLFQ